MREVRGAYQYSVHFGVLIDFGDRFVRFGGVVLSAGKFFKRFFHALSIRIKHTNDPRLIQLVNSAYVLSPHHSRSNDCIAKLRCIGIHARA